MSGFQTPITIYQAIERIRSKAYLLPAFQREYVWTVNQVENLFDSLMKGYPISSMLFWKVCGESKKAYKFYQVLDYYVQKYHIHNEPISTDQLNDFHAVLDGQQRLTSLYLGLCGSYAYHRYRTRDYNCENSYPTRHLYLNISRKLTEDENDKMYDFSFKLDTETQNNDLYVDVNGDKWFRVGCILTLGGDNCMCTVYDYAEDNGMTREERSMLDHLRRVIFEKSSINYYEVDESTPDQAVNIFVRINSGGTALSFSNILMSIAIAGWRKKDARTEINRLVDVINNKGFWISQDYVLRAFLYLYLSDVRFRIKSFNNDFVSLIEDNWEDIRDCIDELFELLRCYGLDGPSLTSNNATLPILYYLYHRKIYKGFSTLTAYAEDREAIRVWLMKSLVLRTFSHSVDAILQASHKAFTDDINECKIKNDIDCFPAAALTKVLKQLQDLTDEYIDNNILSIHKDNKFAFAILSLIYSNLDYRYTFHKDHIHPYSICEETGLDWNIYDTILNLQMLDANENMSKNAKPLRVWIDEMTTEENKSAFLKSHIIPDVDLSIENFDNFIEERRKMLYERIRSIFGNNVIQQADILPESDDFEQEEMEDE